MFEEDPFSDATTEVDKKVMESISVECRKTWHALLDSTDMPKSSKKAWSTIRKLCGDPKAPPQQPKVTANQVANQLLPNGKSGHRRAGKRNILTKPGKAIGLDKISTEHIMNFLDLLQRDGYNSCSITA